MTNHHCINCNKDFKRKEHLINHLKRKNTCQQKTTELSQIAPEQHQLAPEKHQLAPKNIQQDLVKIDNIQLASKTIQQDLVKIDNIQIVQEQSQIILDNIIEEIIPQININKCNYCEKVFGRKSVLSKHIKQNCKIAKQQNKDKQEIFEKLKLLECQNETIINNIKQLENENKLLKEKIKTANPIINNTTNNMNINNNTTNNIIMVSHGQEDLSKICKQLMTVACKRGYNTVPQLIEMIHFNPIFPEFHNVYIPSIKDKHAMIYDKETWSLKNKDEVVNELYLTNRDFIVNNIDGYYKSLTESEKKSLERWLNSDKNKDNNEKDKKAIDYTIEQLKLLLHNKRHIPIATKKQMASISS